MPTISTRTKEAIKTGLAMAIVFGIALQMGWDKPYWAVFTGLMVAAALRAVGQSMKGMNKS